MVDSENGYLNIEQVLAEKGESISSSSGFSMYPMLRHRRDMIVIETVKRPLKKHDVPLYRLPSGKLVLHRILKVTDKCYIIRGDNLFKKEYVPEERIIGVLKAFYRDGKLYDCATNRKYHAYIVWIRLSYPLRYAWKKLIRPVLSKIKHTVFK